MENKIIGRKNEQQILEHCFSSNKPEFIAIYGRRRVGKTFLIRQFFAIKKTIIFFNATGMQAGDLTEQIANFTEAMGSAFFQPGIQLKTESNWHNTFTSLNEFINKSKAKKIVLFFDEFPWMATKKSKLLQTLEYFWNHYWSKNEKIKLIICGSSAGWILNNVINNKGGLYNRVTKSIHLEPFNLSETKSFLAHNKIKLSNKQIIELYSVLGGVPHYLEQAEKDLTTVQIIETLAFTKNGFLLREFDNLYATLFGEPLVYMELVRKIAEYRYGIGQEELANKSKRISSGGTLVEKLKALLDAGIVTSFKPYGHNRRGIYYKVIDEYTNFYFHWIEPIKDTLLTKGLKRGYWDKLHISPSWHNWAGYAFESVCYKHLTQISDTLNLSPTAIPNTWKYVPTKNINDKGAQIDLLFDCDNDSIIVCEIKYSKEPFVIDKQYAKNLQNKVDIFRQKTKTNKQIFIAMISANGIKPTMYSEELISNVVILDDLFK